MQNGTSMTIQAPVSFDVGSERSWEARYGVVMGSDAMLVSIQSRSSIEVVVAKLTAFGSTSYYISSPNFRVAIPSIPSLQETFWITEQLMAADLSAPDAVTVAQVLAEIGDF